MSTETQNTNRENGENVEISKLVAELTNLIADARRNDAEREKLLIEAQTFKLRHVVGAFVAAFIFIAAVKAFL